MQILECVNDSETLLCGCSVEGSAERLTMRTLFVAAAILLLTQSCISAEKDFSTVSFNLLTPPATR